MKMAALSNQIKTQICQSLIICVMGALTLSGCQEATFEQLQAEEFNMLEVDEEHSEHVQDDFESLSDIAIQALSCKKPTTSQLNLVDKGTLKLNRFLIACYNAVGSSTWCQQLTRPNPSSRSVFQCTYGDEQDHIMVHPDETTWKYAFQAAKLVKELQAKSIKVCQIYNWWRAEPYNENVGGAAGRHPFGTSVDVRFCSMADMEKGFKQLCAWRKDGRLRAVGYYGNTGLHFGVGDRTANTWGKACPK